MGSGCAVALAQPIVDCQSCHYDYRSDDAYGAQPVWPQSCGSNYAGDAVAEDIGLCCSRSRPPAPAAVGRQSSMENRLHPLLLLGANLEASTPSTPRGPAPPWVVAAASSRSRPPIDRTSTGATPPRMFEQAMTSPLGLPEELAPFAQSHYSPLLGALGASFGQELFRAARSGDASSLKQLLRHAQNSSLGIACQSSPLGAATSDQAEEAVAQMLSVVRDQNAGETLLGCAAKEGKAATVHLLLESRADPTAVDSRGRMALHRAAESGSLLVTLMVIDRLQGLDRGFTTTDFVDLKGETPGMVAASTGAIEVCRALEAFGDMQNDAEQRRVGNSTGHEGTFGGFLAHLDMGLPESLEAANFATTLLRQAALGTAMVPALAPKLSETEPELRELLEQACQKVREAEDMLLGTSWSPNQPGLSSALRSFARTAELRARWQRLRTEAQQAEGRTEELRDFWQTHITAETMASFARSQGGSLQQVYLGVLWLYSREAWLPHVMDSLACALQHTADDGMSSPSVDGATGATPLLQRRFDDSCRSASREEAALASQLRPMAQALAPMAQLVQGALAYFRACGVQHDGVTYRPIAVPTNSLRKLIDRYLSQREKRLEEASASQPEDLEEGIGKDGIWFSLGSGSFCGSLASRAEAEKQLAKLHCNVLLTIQPAAKSPSFPEHLSLKGGGDDVFYPIGTLFRLVRLSRTTSSEMEPEACPRGTESQWPVTVIELEAADGRPEALELLHRRGLLAPGHLQEQVRSWAEEGASPGGERRRRLGEAADLLLRCASTCESADCKDSYPEAASALLAQSAALAASSGDVLGEVDALLRRAACGARDAALYEAEEAVCLLEASLGSSNPEAQSARATFQALRGTPTTE
ncbi:unnamed protein product [Polarella glacialis]|uniref:Uncharacterized protein n=1 Tax=Polarella glacialis TaxID=89957 RepID=A0A813LHC8_POLGL|nr:unnamed protein product [Polarella glacialis]